MFKELLSGLHNLQEIAMLDVWETASLLRFLQDSSNADKVMMLLQLLLCLSPAIEASYLLTLYS